MPAKKKQPEKATPGNGAKNKGGRPKRDVIKNITSKAITEATITKLYEKGLTDEEVADILEISVRTLHRWKEDERFLSLLKTGKDEADELVKLSLFKNAVGFHVEETHLHQFQGKVIKTRTQKFFKGETVAQFIWLKNRRPEEWRDKIEGNTGDTKELDVGTVNVYVNGTKSKLLKNQNEEK